MQHLLITGMSFARSTKSFSEFEAGITVSHNAKIEMRINSYFSNISKEDMLELFSVLSEKYPEFDDYRERECFGKLLHDLLQVCPGNNEHGIMIR